MQEINSSCLEVQLVEHKARQVHDHQHDDLPNACRVNHRLACGNAFDIVLGHFLDRSHFLAFGFEHFGHALVGGARLDDLPQSH